MSKLNVFYLIESSETGGAENIFLNLVEKTDREKFSVFIGLFYKGWLYDELINRGFFPFVFVSKEGGYDISLIFQLIKFISRNRIDLVCSHLFSASLYAGVAGKFSRVPVVAVFHGTMDVSVSDKKARFKFFVLNICVRKIVYVSEYLKEFFCSSFNADKRKSLVIYNGISLPTGNVVFNKNNVMREELTVDGDDFLVIAIGDIRPAKDYPTLLKAIAQVVQKVANLKLIIAGAETDLSPELECLKEELDLTDCVEFLGYREDVRDILPCCDAYVSSSLSEGFSLTVVEAMAAGVPVIATQSGGPGEIVQDGITGVLVPPSDPHLLANAIIYLYNDNELRSAMVEKARQVAGERFSLDLMLRQYEQLFREIGRMLGLDVSQVR